MLTAQIPKIIKDINPPNGVLIVSIPFLQFL